MNDMIVIETKGYAVYFVFETKHFMQNAYVDNL